MLKVKRSRTHKLYQRHTPMGSYPYFRAANMEWVPTMLTPIEQVKEYYRSAYTRNGDKITFQRVIGIANGKVMGVVLNDNSTVNVYICD